MIIDGQPCDFDELAFIKQIQIIGYPHQEEIEALIKWARGRGQETWPFKEKRDHLADVLFVIKRAGQRKINVLVEQIEKGEVRLDR